MASNQMNNWLAQAYGTNGAGHDSDLEKTAQAMMLSKLAQDEGIDLSGLNEDQLAMLAQEVSQQLAQQQGGEMGGQPGMPGMPAAGGGMPMQPPQAQTAQPPMPMPQAGGAGPGPQAPAEGMPGFSDDQVKVAQAKMAEADFLGRMMAHALHQELNIIKQAEFPAGTQAPPFGGGGGPPKSDEDKKKEEEEEAEKTAYAYLAARGYQVTKQASAEGPLTRAIRALGGKV